MGSRISYYYNNENNNITTQGEEEEHEQENINNMNISDLVHHDNTKNANADDDDDKVGDGIYSSYSEQNREFVHNLYRDNDNTSPRLSQESDQHDEGTNESGDRNESSEHEEVGEVREEIHREDSFHPTGMVYSTQQDKKVNYSPTNYIHPYNTRSKNMQLMADVE
jgi:hypothetical protein